MFTTRSVSSLCVSILKFFSSALVGLLISRSDIFNKSIWILVSPASRYSPFSPWLLSNFSPTICKCIFGSVTVKFGISSCKSSIFNCCSIGFARNFNVIGSNLDWSWASLRVITGVVKVLFKVPNQFTLLCTLSGSFNKDWSAPGACVILISERIAYPFQLRWIWSCPFNWITSFGLHGSSTNSAVQFALPFKAPIWNCWYCNFKSFDCLVLCW